MYGQFEAQNHGEDNQHPSELVLIFSPWRSTFGVLEPCSSLLVPQSISRQSLVRVKTSASLCSTLGGFTNIHNKTKGGTVS
jgi:hypothetical protein